MKRRTWRHKRCGMHRNPYTYPCRLILVLDRITVELMTAHTIAREMIVHTIHRLTATCQVTHPSMHVHVPRQHQTWYVNES